MRGEGGGRLAPPVGVRVRVRAWVRSRVRARVRVRVRVRARARVEGEGERARRGTKPGLELAGLRQTPTSWGSVPLPVPAQPPIIKEETPCASRMPD